MAIVNPEPGTPEWGKCGQCLQPLFLKRHPAGSQCEYAGTTDGPQAPYFEDHCEACPFAGCPTCAHKGGTSD